MDVLTTGDVTAGLSLTSGYAHDLEMIDTLSSSSIFNIMGHDMTVVDAHGVVTTHKHRFVSDKLRAELNIALWFTGVVIVERRYVKREDVENTIDYVKRIAETHKISSRATNVHVKLFNTDNIRGLHEYYIIHRMEKERFNTEYSFFIRGLNLVVSIPNREKVSPLMTQENPTDVVEYNTSETLVTSIEYYSSTSIPMYVNVLNTIRKIEPIRVDDVEDGIYLVTIANGVKSKERISPSDYKDRGVYSTLLEAQKSMSVKDIIEVRRTDLEVMKLEHSIQDTGMKNAIEIRKNMVEADKIISDILFYRDKRTTNICKISQTGGDVWTSIKKIADVIITLRKLL